MKDFSEDLKKLPGQPGVYIMRDEQDADIVMFIHREDYYNEDTDRQNIADLILAKHRRGATGRIELFFDKERVRFMSLDTKHEEL